MKHQSAQKAHKVTSLTPLRRAGFGAGTYTVLEFSMRLDHINFALQPQESFILYPSESPSKRPRKRNISKVSANTFSLYGKDRCVLTRVSK